METDDIILGITSISIGLLVIGHLIYTTFKNIWKRMK